MPERDSATVQSPARMKAEEERVCTCSDSSWTPPEKVKKIAAAQTSGKLVVRIAHQVQTAIESGELAAESVAARCRHIVGDFGGEVANASGGHWEKIEHCVVSQAEALAGRA